jgi:hypothetical protein
MIKSSVCSVTMGGAAAGRAGLSFRVTSLLKAKSFERAIREPGDSDALCVANGAEVEAEAGAVLVMARA